MKHLFLPIIASLFLSSCSLFGKSGVEEAPYTLITKEGSFELRHYESLVLASTSLENGSQDEKGPFRKLFGYISGDNAKEQDISMTAPVFMDKQGGETTSMSFVLPKDFTQNKAPAPTDKSVNIENIKDYTVATVTFNGNLKQKNIDTHKQKLNQWISEKGYKVLGEARVAGYKPPFTLPPFKRNEVLIPVKE